MKEKVDRYQELLNIMPKEGRDLTNQEIMELAFLEATFLKVYGKKSITNVTEKPISVTTKPVIE